MTASQPPFAITSSASKAARALDAPHPVTPYWTPACLEYSQRLWLPTGPAWEKEAHKTVVNAEGKALSPSWFAHRQLTAPDTAPALRVVLPFVAPDEAAPVSSGTITKKIRIRPTAEQKRLFKQWMGTSRRVYNDTVHFLTTAKKRGTWTRAARGILSALPEWARAVPYQIKKRTVFEAFVAFRAGIKRAKETGKPFELHFRTRKNPRQSCYIPKSALTEKGVYHTLSGVLTYTEALPSNRLDARLLCDNGRWYVIVPTSAPRAFVTENQGRVIALDPGVRTFMTGFSATEVVKFGEGDFRHIARLCWNVDRLQSLMAKAKAKKRYRLGKAKKRLHCRLKDLVSELHWKVGRYLVENYDVILLPTFETQEMSLNVQRRIASKTVRAMLTFSHYTFKCRLKHLAAKFGKTVIDVDEAYTSKTASWTGEIKATLGGAKTITSKGVTLDRDVNGARGIFLRALGDNPSWQCFAT
jgi:putative transposase